MTTIAIDRAPLDQIMKDLDSGRYVVPASIQHKQLRAALEDHPEPMVPLTLEWEPGYPEDVAFGTQRQMDRLKKWLDKFFVMRLAENVAPHKPLFADLIAQHEGLADELAAMDTQPSVPSWHDAPTVPGLWMRIGRTSGDVAIIRHLESDDIWYEGYRWFGPIPEDK